MPCCAALCCMTCAALCCAVGEVLHHLWRAQPDAAAHEPMPYTKMLRELLTGDPYYELVIDQQCSSHYWVKLNIEKIKSMLNF
jgi:hypothetical protein